MMNSGLKSFDIISVADKSFGINLGSFRRRFVDHDDDLFMCVNESLVNYYASARMRGACGGVNIFEYVENRINVEKLKMSEFECDLVIRILRRKGREFHTIGFDREGEVVNECFEASQRIGDFKYFSEYKSGHGLISTTMPEIIIEKWTYLTDDLVYKKHHGNYLDFRRGERCGAMRRSEVPKIRRRRDL